MPVAGNLFQTDAYHIGTEAVILHCMAFDLGRALRSQQEGKALVPHPAFMDNSTPVSVYSPGASRQDAKLSQREAKRHSQAYGGDQAIDHVYDAIGLYTDPASTAPWRLEREDGTKLIEKRVDGTPPEYELGPRELYTLLKKPNPFMLYDELVDLLVIDLLLVGNAYWFKWRTTADGKPLALYRLAPSHVKIIPGAFGPKRYEYQPPGAEKPLKIAPEELIHFKRPNPHSAYYGLGVIQGGGRAFDLELAITDTSAHYYENKADPSMIVSSERRVPRDVFAKLRQQLRARTAGPRNSGELLVLEAGLKANSLSANAREALLNEISTMSQDRIYAKFRTSRKLFGLLDEATGGDKIADARREFDNSTLRPFMDRLQRRITDGLTSLWGVNFVIDYRYQMPVEDLVKLGGDFASTPGIKVREVRRFFAPLGLEESTGDKKIDETVLNLPGEELGPNGQPINGGAGFPDRNAPSEPGRPVTRTQQTRAFPRNGGPLPAGAKARQPQGKALSIHSLSFTERADALLARAEGKAVAPDGANVSVGNRLTGEQRPEDTTRDARTADIDSAMSYIESGLSEAVTALERELLDHAEGKALSRPNNKTSNVVGRVRNSSAWKTFRSRVEEVLREGARRSASSAALHSGLEPDEDIDYDAIAASVVNRPQGVRSIVKTLKERVLDRMKDARESDDGDVTAAIREVTTEWTRDWLPGVADSEATEAYNEGTLSVAEAAGVERVWVFEEEDAPDEPCQEADGQLWDITFAREHRKEHPRCRRAFTPASAEAVS